MGDSCNKSGSFGVVTVVNSGCASRISQLTACVAEWRKTVHVSVWQEIK